MVSQRLQQVPASGTLAISNLVSQLKSEGIDVLSFSLGEPDFTTPDNIIEAAQCWLLTSADMENYRNNDRRRITRKRRAVAFA